MACQSSEPEQQLGKLVALEGHTETIATQLRLLPPSSKILILPSILEDLQTLPEESAFNAQAFVRDVHAACGRRIEIARSFLRQSTPAHPRIVFMNGGSVSAQMTCITKISEKLTNGELREADAVFNHIIKDGVTGLLQMNEVVVPEEEQTEDLEEFEEGKLVDDQNEDPSVIAMRAAESLDRATAALQAAEEASVEVNAVPMQTLKAVPRSCLKKSSVAQQLVPKMREEFITSPNEDIMRRSVLMLPALEKRYSLVPRLGCPKHLSTMPHLTLEEDYADDLLSPLADSIHSGVSAPPTPHNVIFGEARLVDVQSANATKRTIRKVTSVGRFFPSNSRVHNLSPRSLRHGASTNFLDVRPTTSDGRMQRTLSTSEFETLPRTPFVPAPEMAIIRTPTVAGSVKAASPARVFVDRGTDAFLIEHINATEAPKNIEPKVFEPVFAVFEDVIIHFADGNDNEIFESVIRSRKHGSHPKAPSPSKVSEYSRSTTNTTSEAHGIENTRSNSLTTTETDDDGHARRHEFDPYRASGVHNGSFPSSINRFWSPKHKLEPMDNGARNMEPLTPATTPPPSTKEFPQKFPEFSAKYETAIDIQNSLRSVLKKHLPTGEKGYSQYYYATTSESDRLWKPVFRLDDASTGSESRTVDQILALGCEKGVNRDFFAEMTGQVENLGTKKNGISRSGKLDLSYLIATALQTFAAHGPNSQTSVDPLPNPTLLATMIIPHLETFLVTNTATRFLIIHYSSTQLPIILALRDLLGSSLFKVAAIIDGLSSDPPFSTTKRPQTLTRNALSSPSMGSRPATWSQPNLPQHDESSTTILSNIKYQKHSKYSSSVSFSKANYLIPSTAMDAEITSFLSGIWKSLIETDSFYNPEPVSPVISKVTILDSTVTTAPPSTPKNSKITPPKTPPHTPTSSLSNTYNKGYKAPNRNQLRSNTFQDEKDSPARRARLAQKSNSFMSSIRSAKNTASVRERQNEGDWANFYIMEEDSEDDAYDRMVLGRAGIIPGKTINGGRTGKGFAVMGIGDTGRSRPGSSKKALKWLGLA